jgi:hypothetical protein
VKTLRGLNILVLALLVSNYAALLVLQKSPYWLTLVLPVVIAIPFGTALFSLLRSMKLRILAVTINVLFLAAVIVFLLILTPYVLYPFARALEGDIGWIRVVAGWALFLTTAACNVIYLLRSRPATSSSVAIQ